MVDDDPSFARAASSLSAAWLPMLTALVLPAPSGNNANWPLSRALNVAAWAGKRLDSTRAPAAATIASGGGAAFGGNKLTVSVCSALLIASSKRAMARDAFGGGVLSVRIASSAASFQSTTAFASISLGQHTNAAPALVAASNAVPSLTSAPVRAS